MRLLLLGEVHQVEHEEPHDACRHLRHRIGSLKVRLRALHLRHQVLDRLALLVPDVPEEGSVQPRQLLERPFRVPLLQASQQHLDALRRS